MSEIRYQVFVSSTYADLKDERANVSQAIMELNCFPAGMELFPASSDEQFDFIKTVIDESDYYVLIIGGRYGTISTKGISYTEMEYDYAESRGIEICAFIHSAPQQIPVGKTDQDSQLSQKLESFKDKVKNGRLVKFWSDPSELPAKVVISLNAAIRRKPATGWVRGDQQANPQTVNRLITLENENLNLKKQISELRAKSVTNVSLFDELNRQLKLTYSESPPNFGILANISGESSKQTIRTFSATIGEIFGKIGFDMLSNASIIAYEKLLPNYKGATNNIRHVSVYRGTYSKDELTENSKKTIELALIALDLIKPTAADQFSLTPKGQKALLEIVS